MKIYIYYINIIKLNVIKHCLTLTVCNILDYPIRNNQSYGLLQLILQEKIEGKRSVEKQRISWLKNPHDWFSRTTN